MEVQGVNVPINVYLEEGIPMMIRGEELLINYFWYGVAGEDYLRDLELRGNVYVIGDVNAQNVTCLDSPQVFVDAGHDVHNLYTYKTADGSVDVMLQGINTQYDNHDGVHRGEPFYDEGNHIWIQINGYLECIGTEERPVLITSSASEPTRWDWNFFDFNGVIGNAIIEYSRGVEPGNNSQVNHSIVRHIGGGTIIIDANNVLVEYNQIYDPGHEGIGGQMTNAVIRHNTIGPIEGYLCLGFFGGNQDLPELYGNTIQGCPFGLGFFFEPDAQIVQEYLDNNTFLDIGQMVTIEQ